LNMAAGGRVKNNLGSLIRGGAKTVGKTADEIIEESDVFLTMPSDMSYLSNANISESAVVVTKGVLKKAEGGKVYNTLKRNCYSEGSYVKKRTKNIVVNDQVVTSSDIEEILKVHPNNLSSEGLDIVQHLINNDETFAKKWREHTDYER